MVQLESGRAMQLGTTLHFYCIMLHTKKEWALAGHYSGPQAH